MSIVVDGRKVFTGEVSFQNDVQIDGDLVVTGAESYTGDNSFAGVVTITGQLDVIGPTNTTGLLTQVGNVAVTGDTTATGAFDIVGAATVSSTLDVTGEATFGVVDILDDFDVSGGTVNIAAAVDELITLETTGTGYIQMNLGSGGLVVNDGGPGIFAIATGTGLTYLPAADDGIILNLTGTGSVSLTSGSGGIAINGGNGNIAIDGTTLFSVTADADSPLALTTSGTGEVTIASEAAINLDGATTVDSSFTVTGGADLQSDTTITGQLTLESDYNPTAPARAVVPYLYCQNVTAAQVNAGLELLPAVSGASYQVYDWGITARGGAAADVTSVDLEDTNDVEIAVVGVALLTENTQVGPNTASVTNGLGNGGALLTVSEGIQIIKAGSDVTGATSFDVWLLYSVVTLA